MKAPAGHASNAGRQRYERPDHRQQPRDEHGQVSPVRKKSICPVEFAAGEQDPAAIALDQRPATVAADLVSHQRSQVAADRACGRHPEQLHRAFIHEITGEGHDQLGRQWNAGGLDGHQDNDAAVSGDRDYGFDEDKENGEDLFGHSAASSSHSALSI